MFNRKRIALLAIALFAQLYLVAQSSAVAGAANEKGIMRSEGKIYVVMAVVITVLTGLILYMIRLDRKITRLEKDQNQ